MVPDGDAVVVAGVRVTHPERILFEELGLTKEALARYYESVAQWMLPELKERPLSLVRCPQGPGEGCFFQKNIDQRWPGEIERVAVELGGGGVYAAANSIGAIVGLVQMGVIELHVWGSTVRDLAKPDRMVFDLDPDATVPWREVMAAAQRMRQRLDDLGLESFPKTSGGKGLHIVVPLSRRHEWDEVKAFSRAFAEAVTADEPQLFTVQASKKLRQRRIFIDWLRNARGATSVANWSLRARPGAPVVMPLRWEELARTRSAADYDLKKALRRAATLAQDPWHDLAATRQALPRG